MKNLKTSSTPEGEQQLDSKVEQLLLSKSYEQLNATEKQYVEAHLSEEDYSSFRQILLSTKAQKTSFSHFQATSIQDNLLREFRQRKQPPGLWDKIRQALQHPIPSWQVALACLALCFGTYFLSSSTKSPRAVNDGLQEQDAKVILTSRSAEEERELLMLLTGVR